MDSNAPIEVEQTFRLLKDPCSSILGTPSIGAANARLIANHLDQIHTVLQDILSPPEQHFPEPLVKYVVFVLFHVFRLLNRFTRRETRFDFLIEPWLACLRNLLVLPHAYAIVVGRSIDDARVILEALLIMIDGLPTVDNPADPVPVTSANVDPRKRKKDRMADDVRLQALKCLIAFIPVQSSQTTPENAVGRTDTSDDSTLLFATRSTPSPADHFVRQQLLNPEDSRSEAIIGQMIVILLETGTGTVSVPLRVAGMEAMDRLLHCFHTPSALARWMPGVLAGLTSTMLAKGLMDHHSVHVKALCIMSYVIATVLRDESEGGLRQRSGRHPREINAENIRKMMETHGATAQHTDDAPKDAGTTTPQFGTAAWVQKTRSALKVLFKRIANLRAHTHWQVRRQFGEFAFLLLKYCSHSLGDNAQFMLETLIGCLQDEFDTVAEPARIYLSELSTLPSNLELENVGIQVLRGKLLALPRVLHGPDESLKLFTIKTLCGLVLFLGQRVQISIQQEPWETIQPWLGLLSIDRLDAHYAATDHQGVLAIVQQSMEAGDAHKHLLVSQAIKDRQAWITWAQHLSQLSGSGEAHFGFPRKVYRFLHDQTTADAFQAFLRQFGFSTDIAMWYSQLSLNPGDAESETLDESTLPLIVLSNQLLLGAAGMGVNQLAVAMPIVDADQDSEKGYDKIKKQQKKQRRHVRRIARDILGDYLDMLSRLDFSVETVSQQMTRSAGTEILQGGRGLSPDQPADSKVHIQLACLLLEGIASIAIIVGQDFETELIRVLYPLLELLSDPDSLLIRDTAEAALNHVAFATGYNSIGDMLSENYDYVVQQVSQRIAFITRNPKTPQVLISLIRVVGPRAVTMLEDSVTEIMIALDMQVELQEPIASGRNSDDLPSEGLLKALCEITRAMALEKSRLASPSSSESETAQGGKALARTVLDVTPSRLEEASVDVLRFSKQYQALVQISDRDEEEKELSKQQKMTPTEIRQYFMDRAAKAKEEKEMLLGESDHEDGEEEDGESFGKQKYQMPAPEAKEVPPTKHEALCLRIFNKAGYFLSSSTPRMRVLALEIIYASIPVLRHRTNEFYPAIHDLWGSIMARLRLDPEFFVSLRAIEVITALADHCSNFLKKKLLDDVWPFILQALRVWTKKPAKALPSPATQRAAQESSTASRHSMFSTPSSGHGNFRKKATPTTGKLFTREHRLQMTTLQSMSKIVRVIQAPVKDIWEMIVLSCEFLDQYSFHIDVQEAAIQLIKDLAERHGDPVWLALTETLEREEWKVERLGEGEGGKIEHCTKLLQYLEEQQL